MSRANVLPVSFGAALVLAVSYMSAVTAQTLTYGGTVFPISCNGVSPSLVKLQGAEQGHGIAGGSLALSQGADAGYIAIPVYKNNIVGATAHFPSDLIEVTQDSPPVTNLVLTQYKRA